MKKLLNLLTICILFNSCVKDGHSNLRTKLTNSTNHNIKITPYFDGNPILNNIINLSPAETIEVAIISGKGKVNPTNFGDILMDYDSVEVVFDNSFSIKHIKDEKQGLKYISFSNPRNLINTNNYKKVITAETNISITGFYSFIFTEQDYLDASQ